MSDKYNDDKIKDIMQSAEIPSELEPENIKTMLDKFAVQKQRRTAIEKKGYKNNSCCGGTGTYHRNRFKTLYGYPYIP